MKSKKGISMFIVALMLTGALIGVISISSENAQAAGIADTPWPMFRGNLNHTGLSPYDTSGNDGTLRWKYSTGGDIYSSPAIGSDGTIYIGSDDSNLYAINSDGTLKWTYTTGGISSSNPAIGSDGTIYIGSTYYYNLYAINSDGTLKWTYTTGGCIYSSPAIGSDGTIYIGSDDSNLYAINSDGTLKWTYTTGGYIHSSPAIGSDGTIYVGSRDSNLYAINSDGTLKWRCTTGAAIYSSPAIGSDGTIYIGSNDSNLYAIGDTSLGSPQSLQANAGDSYVYLTWNAPVYDGGSAITNYTIYRGTSSGSETLLANVGNVLNYNDTSVTNGQTYYYYVTAVNGVGEGEKSNEVSVTPVEPIEFPSAPQNLEANAGDSYVYLTWNAPVYDGGSAITNYTIYRGTSSGSEVFFASIDGNTLNYTDNNLVNGQTYYYRVSAVNSAGEGEKSTEVHITPVDCPDAAMNLVAEATDGQVKLSWNAPEDDGGSEITNYRIYRGTSSGSEVLLVMVGNVLNYTDASVENGQTYYYRVSAVNSAGEGENSTEVSATPEKEMTQSGTGSLSPITISLILVLILLLAVIGILLYKKSKNENSVEEKEELPK